MATSWRSAETTSALSHPTLTGTLTATLVADDLFSLARIPGADGTKPGTRDEIVCALKVMTIDEDFIDPRFEPGGEFAGFHFRCRGSSSPVERRVRDRYLMLAATNDDHFVAPGGITHKRHPGNPTPFGSAVLAHRYFHRLALEHACRLGRSHGDLSQAMAREAAAQHFLTDAFTAGHLRTPVAQIRRYWHSRYPNFWENLQLRLASDTASTLRELAWALRRLPARFLHDSTPLGAQAEDEPSRARSPLTATRCTVFSATPPTSGARRRASPMSSRSGPRAIAATPSCASRWACARMRACRSSPAAKDGC
jgi:hypothetical protein